MKTKHNFIKNSAFVFSDFYLLGFFFFLLVFVFITGLFSQNDRFTSFTYLDYLFL